MAVAQKAYSTIEIARVLSCPRKSVLRRAEREGWVFQERIGRGGGNLFPLATLPDEVRLALATAATAASDHEAATRKLREELAARAAEACRQTGMTAFAALPEQRRNRAEARALIARLCNDFLATSGLSRRRGTALFAADYNAGRAAVPDWTREEVSSLCAGSIRNWQLAMERDGMASLAGKHGRHRIGTGKIDGNPALAEFCLGFINDHPHSTAAGLFEAMLTRFGVSSLPTLRAVQRWFSGWKLRNPQLFLAISNPDAWRNRYMSAAGDASAGILRLNQHWEMDSTPGDLLLADGTRHTIVGCIDVFSRRLTLHVSRSSSSAAVAATLRKALLKWGVPEMVKTDNGSDYVSRHITSLLLGLDIRRETCAPFSPWQKPFIERALGTFSHDLLEFLSGFIGHSVADRKDIEARRSFAQRLMKKGEEPAELRMGPEELQEFCDRWAEDVYGRKAHSELNGKSPWQMAVDWTGPLRSIMDERALDVLLLPAPGEGTRRVTKKGLRVDGNLFAHANLGGLEGQDVQVRLDDADIGHVYVFDLDGAFVCKAVCPEILGISRQEVAVAQKRHQSTWLAGQKKIARAASRKMGTKDIAAEIMAARAAEAASLVALPRSGAAYETPALLEAGLAARSINGPAPLSRQQEDRLDEQTAALAAEMAVAKPAPETPEVRFARAIHMQEMLEKGEILPPDSQGWLNLYMNTGEYLGWRSVYDTFGKVYMEEVNQLLRRPG